MLTDNPHYTAYARSIRELHRLILQGQGDSAEADEIRDGSDEHWPYLSIEEIGHLQSLSADLYALGETPSQSAAEFPDASVFGDFQQAFATGDFDKVVTILRRPDVKTEAKLGAAIRARYWLGLGDYENALPFLDEAVRLDPEAPDYRLARLVCLWIIGDGRAFDEAILLIDDPILPGSDDVIEVCTVLGLSALDRARSRGNPITGLAGDEREAIDRVIAKLSDVLMPRNDAPTRPTPDFRAIADEVLGLCYWWRSSVEAPSSSLGVDADFDINVTEMAPIETLVQMAGRINRHCREVFRERIPQLAA